MITNIKIATIIVMALFYIVVGVAHFLNPDPFLLIVPPYLPYKLVLVYISGFFEIFFGFLMLMIVCHELIMRFNNPNLFRRSVFKNDCITKYKSFYSFGLILLLIAVFPANYYLYESDIARELYGSITKDQAFIRMLFQPLLIITAYWHGHTINDVRINFTFLLISIITIVYFTWILI